MERAAGGHTVSPRGNKNEKNNHSSQNDLQSSLLNMVETSDNNVLLVLPNE